MTTKLTGPLKRELDINGIPYTLTISPACLHLTRKGRRKGYELAWTSLVSGEAALVTALNESLHRIASVERDCTAQPGRTGQLPTNHTSPPACRKAARTMRGV